MHHADGVKIREYMLHSIYSRVSNKTLKSSSGIPAETKKNCSKAAQSSTFPLVLCHGIHQLNFVVTTSAFRPLPGDTLTVQFSGKTVGNYTHMGYFSIEITCSYDGTQNFYGSLELDVACLNRTNYNVSSRFPEVKSFLWESLHANSEYDGFLLEVDFSKFDTFIKNSTLVLASLTATANHLQSDQKITRRNSLFYYSKSKAQSNVVRIPVDEALRPRTKSNQLRVSFTIIAKDLGLKRLPYVRGAVKLVMLSRSSSCSRNECKKLQHAKVKMEDAQIKGCYTIGELYKSCYGKK